MIKFTTRDMARASSTDLRVEGMGFLDSELSSASPGM